MTKTRIKIMTGLALVACVILVTGIVGAKATRVAVPEIPFTYGPTVWPWPGVWTTNGDIQHIRRLPYMLTGAGGDLEIVITGTCNHSRSLVTLDGNLWGDDDTVEVTWGELSGTFRGRHTGKTIDWVGYTKHVYHGISGDFVGMKLMLDGVMDYATKSGSLEGILLDPHGE